MHFLTDLEPIHDAKKINRTSQNIDTSIPIVFIENKQLMYSFDLSLYLLSMYIYFAYGQTKENAKNRDFLQIWIGKFTEVTNKDLV